MYILKNLFFVLLLALSLEARVINVKPIHYYYAEGIDGLSTECNGSFHVEALNFAGGKNVHSCNQSGVLGLEKINFETLLTYNPEVIYVSANLKY